VSDDILVYGQFSQGFRAGGANQNTSSIAITDPGNVEVPEAFKSDTLDSYEIGIHSQWLDRRLTINGAVYYIDWKDIVVTGRSATGLFAFLTNADGAEATGFELESILYMATDFHVTAAVSYVDAQLTANAPPNRASPTLSRSGLKGDRLPDVADWTAHASMEYGRQLPWRDLRGFFYVDGAYTGESFADFNPFLLDINTLEPTSVPNTSFKEQGDYVVVDLRFGVEAVDWSAALFVENVFDEKGPTQVFEDGTFRLNPGLNFIERPRTFGVVFTKDF
jgi:outer membrane receptor protein involved in Fe transport